MFSMVKKVATGLLTALLLFSFFSFNVSASTIEVSDSFARPAGVTLTYRSRVLNKKKWQSYKNQAYRSGSDGKKKKLEAIQIKIKSSVPGSIQYRAHAYMKGWGPIKKNGQVAGGKGYKLDRIRINLTGELAEKYDIYYRVHLTISNGWLDWAKNGEDAGVADYAFYINGFQIVLTEKGAGAPGDVASIKSQRSYALLNAQPIKDAMTQKAQAYSSKTNWLILCDTSKYFAGVFKGSKGNWKLVRFIYVGVGKASTPTKKGTFTIKSKKKKFFSGAVRCKYCTRYTKNYYLHSVPYTWDGKRVYSPVLGKQISHGCIRMATADAKYIYKNVPIKTTAYVY